MSDDAAWNAGFGRMLASERARVQQFLGEHRRKLAEIQALGVALPWRGHGLGKQLVQLCVELARERGVYELMAITASEHLFRDCGFDYSLPDQKKALFIQLYQRH